MSVGTTFDYHKGDNVRKVRDTQMGSKENNPGPGQYMTKSKTEKQAPSYSMGIKSGPLKGNMEVPGPGKYNPNVSASLSGGVAVGIGTGERSKLGGNANGLGYPGPGQYNTQTSSDAMYCSRSSQVGKSKR